MQITETSSDGLKRELKVTIPQGELSQRFATRLDEVKDTVQLKGFRKGKVPVAHIKKLLRPLADGRGAAAGRRGDEPRRHQGAQRARRAPAQHQPDRGQGRDRAGAVGRERSRLHDVLRGAARHQGHRPCRAQARAGGRRRDARGGRQGRRRAGGALRALRGGGGAGRRRRRPRHHRLRRPHRRHRVRGRQGRGRAAGRRPVAVSFRASSRASRAPRPARSARSTPSSPTPIRRRTWPARTPSSTSRSRRWQSRSGPSSTTTSPRRWARRASPSSRSWSAPRSPANTPPSRA